MKAKKLYLSSNQSIKRTHLKIVPEIGSKNTRTFGKVKLFIWKVVVESVLIADLPYVAMERNARKRIGCSRFLHLAP